MSKRLSNTGENALDLAPVKVVPFSDVIAVPENNSRRFQAPAQSVKELSQDLIVRGQLFPLLVVEGHNGHEGKYVLCDGFRRYDAMALAAENGSPIDPIVRVFPNMTQLDAFKLSVAANNPVLRKEPSLIDYSYQIQTLRSGKGDEENGMAMKDIAHELGKSAAWVSVVGKLITLRPTIQKAIHHGEITFGVARALTEMDEETQDKTLAEVEQAKEKGFGVTEVAQARKPKKKGKRAAGGSGEQRLRGTGKKGALGGKVIVNTFEELAAVAVGEDGVVVKQTKAEEKLTVLFGILAKFAAGKMGAKTMVKQVVEVL